MAEYSIADRQIDAAAARYSRAVTGPMSGCPHPASVLRWALAKCADAGCRRLAANYVLSGHGACWNAMVACMPAIGWLVWHTGDWQGLKSA
jgi:hypothetical protein